MPPKIVSSTRSAKRRSSWREMPGPPRQTWYCSVSLRSNLPPARAWKAGGRRRSVRRAPRVEPDRPLLGQRHELVVVDRSGGGDHDVGRHVARAVKGRDLLGRRLGDHRGPADDRPPQRIVAEHRLAEHVEHLLLRIVLVHRDLLQDHRPLGSRSPAARAGTPCRPSRRTPRPGAGRSPGRRPRSSPCRCRR